MTTFFSIDDLSRAKIEQIFVQVDELSLNPQIMRPERMLASRTERNIVAALLDLYIVYRSKGTLDGQRVALLGDLKFNAVVQTFARLLGLFDVCLSLVSPAALAMSYDLSESLRENGLEVEETNDLAASLHKADVLYLARIDSTHVEKKVYDKTKDFYNLSPKLLSQAKPDLLLLGEWDGVAELLVPYRTFVTQMRGALLAVLG